MRRTLLTFVVTIGALSLCGCSPAAPSYDDVRAETDAILQLVTDLVPEPKEIVPNDSIKPYSCSDPLLSGRKKGSFYTGQWAVFVDDDFDVRGFLEKFPAVLGDEWHEDDLRVPVNFAQIHLVRDAPRMTLTLEEATIDGRKAIDLLAISRCGTLSEDQRP